jgi:heme/copper-type cytochrome/quinol oxidase subunit 4
MQATWPHAHLVSHALGLVLGVVVAALPLLLHLLLTNRGKWAAAAAVATMASCRK